MDSIWCRTCQIKERAPLLRDLETEVAVIGAGMAGVLIASALQEAGKRVVVLEADRIAGGQTGNTTAKLTSQHGMIYRYLTDALGEEKARQYAMANEAALSEIRRVIAERQIDCDLERRMPMSTATTRKNCRMRRNVRRLWASRRRLRKRRRSPFPPPERYALSVRHNFTR